MSFISVNKIKYAIILNLSLLPLLSLANTINDGLNAVKNNDNKEAVLIWSKLASDGDTIAKYNLAEHYSKGKGIEKDKSVSEDLYKDATRTGLVQAYIKLNKKALKPGNGTKITFSSGPLFWLNEQDPQKYTIQLASSRYEKSIAKYYEDNNLSGKGGYYRYSRDGVDRYALIYGVYETVAAANTAIANLPEELRKKTPWVRKIQSLQNISK